MYILLITAILLTILFVFYIINPKTQAKSIPDKNEKFQIYNKPCVKNITQSCYNEPLRSDKCWATQVFPCPKYNGSYMQCTNNFIHPVNMTNCQERSYEYAPKDERLSEKCVYQNVFPFAVKKDIPNNTTPSIFPRVNMWRNDSIDDGFFVSL